jgi:hypothetical protein
MIILLNVGRFLMVIWIIYALIRLFAPHFLHTPPDDASAAIQALVAFAVGHLMDRALGVLRRRKAERMVVNEPARDANEI